MSFESIISDIKKGDLAPVYLLMGDEPFYIDKISSAIEKTALPEDMKGFNQTIVYGLDTDVNQIISLAKSYPMMGERQVVIVKEAQSLGKSIQGLNSYAENPQPSTVLVLNYKNKKVDKRTSLVKAIQKNGVVFTSGTVPEWKLDGWIAKHSRLLKLQLSEKQCNILGAYLGNDLSRINTELEKLKSIINDGPVTDEVIEKYIGISKDYNIYEFQKAVLNRDFSKALKITTYYTKNPKNHHIIPGISALYNIFTRWIKFYYLKDKSKEGARNVGVTPFYFRDYHASIKKYSLKEIVSNISILKEYDLKAKGLGNSGNDPAGLYIELVQRLLLK